MCCRTITTNIPYGIIVHVSGLFILQAIVLTPSILICYKNQKAPPTAILESYETNHHCICILSLCQNTQRAHDQVVMKQTNLRELLAPSRAAMIPPPPSILDIIQQCLKCNTMAIQRYHQNLSYLTQLQVHYTSGCFFTYVMPSQDIAKPESLLSLYCRVRLL